MTLDLIVMGASWGGLQALETILTALPPDFETPIAIAQHRAVDSDDATMARMIGLHSGREVREAGDKDPIESGRVYIAPSDYHLIVDSDGFALSTEGAVHHSRPSIDVLFETASDVFRDRLTAVILTGANQDGAAGIAAVRRRGGLTIAQDPAGAERPDMPAAAIATGAVQHVLGLAEIGPFLLSGATGSRSAA